jgi:hypothetical protein
MSGEDKVIRKYLSAIGRRGGKRSRRTLDSDSARSMVQVREAKRAFQRHFFECFWYSDPDLVITKDDIGWIADQLKKYGSVECWKLGRRLCP